jgi:hypothetical protein
LSLANELEDDNTKNNTDKKFCILKRGQWWLSHGGKEADLSFLGDLIQDINLV